MKRIVTVLVSAVLFCTALSAQPRAVGMRFGYGLEAEYQHYFGRVSFLDLTLGVDAAGTEGFKFCGTYNWEYAHPNWSSVGTWTLYAGIGAGTGYVASDVKGTDPGFALAAAVQLGFEWAPMAHLAFSADIRPMFGYHFGQGEYYQAGMMGLIPMMSIKYKF